MSSTLARRVGLVALVVVLLIIPYQFDEFWVQTGLFAMAAAIAAIGLTVLVGVTGQLSLGHAFFIAVGAYGYSYFAGEKPTAALAATQPTGLSLPTWLAVILAVLLAGVAGALFSPIAGRLRGIYLGLASLGLVFIGQHLMLNVDNVTGGFNGRSVPDVSLFGFTFGNDNPDELDVFGVNYEKFERLWYLGLALVALCWWSARNLVNSRPGRALQAVRDSEIAAGTMGIDVRLYKAAAFTISSMFAGLGGVFFALVFEQIVPESFGFLDSIDFLVMIVLGGLGSIGGAVVGAVVVSSLPLVFSEYADSLPLVSEAGSGGVTAEQAARLLYGAAVIAILIFAPRGLAGLAQRPRNGRRRGKPAPSPSVPNTKESTA